MKSLKDILNSDLLVNLEMSIVKDLGTNLYCSDLQDLFSLLDRDLKLSGLGIDEIEIFIKKEPELLQAFSKAMWSNRKPENLAKGFSITYSIYLIYLMHKTVDELTEYIRSLRIPKEEKFVKKLNSLYRDVVKK
jgi:hypothetical protein